MKAIAAKRRGKLEVADPERLRELIIHWNKTIRDRLGIKLGMRYGTG